MLELTDDRLFDYPFIYIIEPGALYFSEAEVKALRRYCMNGGFLMVDDFWGESQYENLPAAISTSFSRSHSRLKCRCRTRFFSAFIR